MMSKDLKSNQCNLWDFFLGPSLSPTFSLLLSLFLSHVIRFYYEGTSHFPRGTYYLHGVTNIEINLMKYGLPDERS